MTTLLKLVEDWTYSLGDKKVVGVLSSDLSKASDSLHSPLLLAKLKGYGWSVEVVFFRTNEQSLNWKGYY